MALPREASVKQLMKFKKLTGNDIGDKTKNIGSKSANLNYIKGLPSMKITSYEDFIKNKEGHFKGFGNKKTKKSKMKRKRSIKENIDPQLDCTYCDGKLVKNERGENVCEKCGKPAEKVNESKDDGIRGPFGDSFEKPLEINVDGTNRYNGGQMGPTGRSLYGTTNYKEKKPQSNETLDLLRLGKHVNINGKGYFIDKVERNMVTLKSHTDMEVLELTIKEFLKKTKPDEGTFRVKESGFMKKFESFSNKVYENRYTEDTYDIFKTLQNEFDNGKLKVEKTKDGENVLYEYVLNDGTKIECEYSKGFNTPTLYIDDKQLTRSRGEERFFEFFELKSSQTNENILPRPIKRVKCAECGEKVDDTWQQKIYHVQNKHFIKPTLDDNEIDAAVKTCFP